MTTSSKKRQRRIRGEGSFGQRANGLWVGTVDLGWHGGRRIRKSVSARSKAEAQRKFLKLKEDVAPAIRSNSAPRKFTVEQWLTHWLTVIVPMRDVSPRTLMCYRHYVNRWLIPEFGPIRLDNLKAHDIRMLYTRMQTEGLSNGSRRLTHKILKRALEVARRDGLILVNQAANVDAPPMPGPESHRLPLTLQDARTILASLDGNPLAARWIAALLMGMRQGECLGLRWQDVDLERNIIHVDHSLGRVTGQGLVLGKTKTSNKREIPILPVMRLALDRTERRGPYVFYGTMMDAASDRQNWYQLLMASGVCQPGETNMPVLAAARPTTSTLLRDLGVDVTVIRDVLGHATVTMTQEAYMRTDEASMRKALLSLEDAVAMPIG